MNIEEVKINGLRYKVVSSNKQYPCKDCDLMGVTCKFHVFQTTNKISIYCFNITGKDKIFKEIK